MLKHSSRDLLPMNPVCFCMTLCTSYKLFQAKATQNHINSNFMFWLLSTLSYVMYVLYLTDLKLTLFVTLFLKANPSVWTLGHVVPVYTREMFVKYGKGLALNSMEGREAKHQAISRFAKNSNYNTRWLQIFRHEFVSLIWLKRGTT